MLLPEAEGCIQYKVVTRKSHGIITRERQPLPIQLAYVVYTTYSKPGGVPDRLHGCTEVTVQRWAKAIVPVKCIEGPVHLVPVNENADEPNVYLVNNHSDLETYYYVY